MQSKESLKKMERPSLEEQISGIKELIDSPYWKLLSIQIKQNWLNQLMTLEMKISAVKRSDYRYRGEGSISHPIHLNRKGS